MFDAFFADFDDPFVRRGSGSGSGRTVSADPFDDPFFGGGALARRGGGMGGMGMGMGMGFGSMLGQMDSMFDEMAIGGRGGGGMGMTGKSVSTTTYIEVWIPQPPSRR